MLRAYAKFYSMAIAKFIFTDYKHSFKVVVENLEKLSVEDIQSIEAFVSMRKGIFDFNNYSFIIQKKIDFYEFTKLIENSSINAFCIHKPQIVLNKKRVGFGQYKGMQYSEIPDSYLLWLKSNYNGVDKKTIEKEIIFRKL